MLRAPVRSANRDKSLGEAPGYTPLEFTARKRISPNQNSAWLQAPIKRPKQPLGFPLLAAFSVGSPPAQLSAALRVLHSVSALRVCAQAPSRLKESLRGKSLIVACYAPFATSKDSCAPNHSKADKLPLHSQLCFTSLALHALVQPKAVKVTVIEFPRCLRVSERELCNTQTWYNLCTALHRQRRAAKSAACLNARNQASVGPPLGHFASVAVGVSTSQELTPIDHARV